MAESDSDSDGADYYLQRRINKLNFDQECFERQSYLETVDRKNNYEEQMAELKRQQTKATKSKNKNKFNLDKELQIQKANAEMDLEKIRKEGEKRREQNRLDMEEHFTMKHRYNEMRNIQRDNELHRHKDLIQFRGNEERKTIELEIQKDNQMTHNQLQKITQAGEMTKDFIDGQKALEYAKQQTLSEEMRVQKQREKTADKIYQSNESFKQGIEMAGSRKAKFLNF